jgi:tetratricopeptide (TPR) repeat protein
VSYDNIAGVLKTQGNLPEAMKSYRDGLAIADRLAKADPNDADWQLDLSVSYNKIGDVLKAQGHLPEAMKSSSPYSSRCTKSDNFPAYRLDRP